MSKRLEFELDPTTPEQFVVFAGPIQPDGRRRDWLGTFSPKYLTVLNEALCLYNEQADLTRCEVGAGNGTDEDCDGSIIHDPQPECYPFYICAKHLLANRDEWMRKAGEEP